MLWTGLGAAALAMAVLRPARARVKALSMVAVACVVISGAAQVNQKFGAYPTLRTALGLNLASQVDFSSVPGPTPALTIAQPGTPLSQSWSPPQTMPNTGIVSTVTIPGLVSGFAARKAWIYLPPAYLSIPRVQLPVLVLVPGQPGTPRDWFDGGRLDAVLDSYAGGHAGLAPIVVVADPLGSQLAQTLCVDSVAGNAFTYLSVDVPSWIRSTLQVDPDPRRWAVGGMSAGGTCALQLAVNAPAVYPTFLDISGQDEPTVGTRRQTVTQFFGGDPQPSLPSIPSMYSGAYDSQYRGNRRRGQHGSGVRPAGAANTCRDHRCWICAAVNVCGVGSLVGVIEPQLHGVLVVVVDKHDGAVRAVEYGGGNRGSVTGCTVHPHFAGGNVRESVKQFVEGDVDSARDMAVLVLGVLAGVEHGYLTVTGGGGESSEVGHFIGPQFPVTDERVNLSDSGTGGAVDADARQLSGGLCNLV